MLRFTLQSQANDNHKDKIDYIFFFFRYHHLARDFVDEKDYPANNEYILYSYSYVKVIFTLYSVENAYNFPVKIF